MSDVVSLELLLDDETERRVRAEWAALAEAGLSSLGAHPSPSNRPHITLLVRPQIPHLAIESLREAVPLPLAVTLGAPLLFGSGERRVLARSVVVSAALLRLHQGLHSVVGAGDDAPHTRPGEWMPHVTLARRLRLDSLPRALHLLDQVERQPLPFAGHGTAVPPETAAEGEPAGHVSFAVALRRWDSATATVTDLLGRADQRS